MVNKILGYAAKSPSAPLAPYQFEVRSLREDDVAIDILYCGVCHSDLHQARNDWNASIYPIVPGHEIIGHVTAVGNKVNKFKVGDLVGVGCMVDSCRHCSACQQGLEQYCEEGFTFTYNSHDRHDNRVTYGGYAQAILCAEDFVLHVPNNLAPEGVAPLLCAGITTWSPLRQWGVTKGSKVAIIGLGGLGHMALKFAHALGAEVTLFTRSIDKEADARRLGAHHVVLSTDKAQMDAVKNEFEVIIDTVPYSHDINPYLPTLMIDGTLVFVGLIGDVEPTINTSAMIFGRRAVAGSCIGGIAETQEMLDFCGKHNITADIELIDIKNINQAFERMIKSDVKYRFVIDMKTLSEN
ncbi:alcohol dehydrogenase [Proteus hauseri ATCC 700826]|uniref:Alcohol dehydrogenase n=1 Tax=Proteus hauseri ATCC 700826 TaxID=1354271 RepID=A0AAJ3HRU5_PROHU|nr:NAD(P)-dependent alcohol dehydrogenase [Proteus hauseri]OAT46637.1 alcohol dehydrogenase [Proteus hauseri ATCC 700826]